MIWKIAKKEFLLNLMTFKFAVGETALEKLGTLLKNDAYKIPQNSYNKL